MLLAKKPPKKKSKTKKKKASNALNKSDATAQVQLKSSPGVEIKAPQYSGIGLAKNEFESEPIQFIISLA